MSEEVKIEDIAGYKYVENLTCNPSGTAAAYQLASGDLEKNTYRRDIWLIEKDRVRQLTSTIDASIACWDDDENLLLVRHTDDTKPYTTDVYKISIHGGEAVLWAHLPFVLDSLKKVKDGVYAASGTIDMHHPDVYLMNDEDRKKYADDTKEEKENYQVVDEVPYWFNGQNFVNGSRTALFLVKTDPLSVKRIMAPAFDLGFFTAEDEKVYFTGYERHNKEVFRNEIYVMDAEGKVDVIDGRDDYDFGQLFFLDGQLYAFGTDHKTFGVNETRKCLKVEKDKITELFKPERSLYSSLCGDTQLGGGRESKVIDNHFVTVATDDYRTVIWDYDSSFNKKEIRPEGMAVMMIDVTKDTILFAGQDWNHLMEVYAMDRDGKNLRRLTHHNDSALENKYIGRPEMFTYESAGEKLNGWVIYPKDYDAAKKYPAVFDIHGGPRAVYSDLFFHEMQVWASHGYFVFYTNIRGSDGRGDEFADIRDQYGYVDYQNLMDFMDAVLKKYPAIDPKRVCETGGSYGGFMTNWIIGHTDRFAACASQRSISNWISKSFMSDIGLYFGPDQCGAESPFAFAKLWEHSPLKYAENVKTPTLFIHSDQDRRCPLPEGMQMMQALAVRDVETRMVIFHGETHELSRSGKPKHRIRRLTEITDWFDAHTK